MAVETGYWPLFRYQPAPHVAGGNGDGGEAPRAQLVLDSKKLKPGLEEFLDRENRCWGGGRRSGSGCGSACGSG
jgi:pyruvate/2-oxoacid:ferredoxin oxidoreductase beta subunit